MRRIKKEELEKLSIFLVEQFAEKELKVLFRGIDSAKMKNYMAKNFYFELEKYYKDGDIFVYDNHITGALVGMKNKGRTLIGKIPTILKALKIKSDFSKEEAKQFKENALIMQNVTNLNWYKKYCSKKNSYYLGQFAIDKEFRGKGICREMLENFFNSISESIIVLETHDSKTASIYEHFGFKLVETKVSKDKSIKEYRLIKGLEK
jgi:Acetyltransferases